MTEAAQSTESTQTNPFEGVDSVEDAGDILAEKWERGLSDNPEPEAGEPQQPETRNEEPEEEPEAEESDEDQPEAEAEPEEESSEDTEPEAEKDDSFTLTINGEEATVSLNELKAGYLRQSDYTRKTQEVSEARKQIAEAQEQVHTQAKQQLDQIGFLANQLMDDLSNTEQQTNWEELRQLDPAEYAARREAVRDKREKLQQAYNLHQQYQQQAQQLQQQQFQTQLQDEQVKLTSAIPEWSDSATRKSETEALRNFLLTHRVPLTEEQINGLHDHVSVYHLRRSMLYDQLTSKQKQTTETAKAKKVKDLPKVRAGTAKDPDNRNTASDKAMKKLKKSGDIDSAADWLMTRMG